MNRPEQVVQRQLEAYNARDLPGLLATYAEDAVLWEHPNQRLASGRDEIAERFQARFKEPNLHATLISRVVVGSKVFDHELVTRTFPEGEGTLEVMMIYEVAAGRISGAWAVVGEKS